MEWAEILLKNIHYDPETGVFSRKRRFAPNAPAGVIDNAHDGSGHMKIRINRKKYYAHRLAWLYMTGDWPKYDIDHINGNGMDNRWANLRDVPTMVNCQNQKKANRANKSTGLLGSHKCGRYFTATIQVKGKPIYLGNFRTAQAAHEAYISAKRTLHEGCTI